MLLSVKKRFIFVHIYKVAGESIKAALAPYAAPPLIDRLLFKTRVTTSTMQTHRLGRRFPKHATAAEVKAGLPADIYATYFKFAFVRNPWDWQVSLYHYGLRDKYNKHHDIIAAMSSFDEYIEWRVFKERRLQKDFVTDQEGTLIVDFVGRYERLAEDFGVVCQRLDIKTQLPHKNRSKTRQDWRSYYNQHTYQLVADHFADDLTFFGYTADS